MAATPSGKCPEMGLGSFGIPGFGVTAGGEGEAAGRRAVELVSRPWLMAFRELSSGVTGPRGLAPLAPDARILREECKSILQCHITTEAFGNYVKLLIPLSNIVVTGFLGENTGGGRMGTFRWELTETSNQPDCQPDRRGRRLS